MHACLSLRTFNFLGFQGYSPLSEFDFCSVSSKLNFYFSSFTGASYARIDGLSLISLTYSICLVYKIWNLRTFNILNSKAIAHHCRSAISVQF